MSDGHALLNACLALVAKPKPNQPTVLDLGNVRSLHLSTSATQSEMRMDEPDALVLEYTQAMMGFLFWQPQPRRISIIGLGGGSLAKYCYRYLPDAHVVAVDIDPDVIALRDQFMIPADNHRFEVICADGAEYVRQQTARPDVILVDGFSGNGMAPQLGTDAFYQACHERLSDNGILVANFVDGDRQIPTYIDRVEAVFGDACVVITVGDSGNQALFAWKGNAELPTGAELDARADALANSQAVNLFATVRRIKRRINLARHLRARWG